tara:strand:+ start:307 stop:600 length:294 start_codon:yes stop_codon:yes gene_type:complete
MSTDSKERVRVHPADSIGLGISDHAVRINFGLEEAGGEIVDQTSVFITHKTLKMLQLVLTTAVKHIETASGSPIPFDAGRLTALDDALGAGIKKVDD